MGWELSTKEEEEQKKIEDSIGTLYIWTVAVMGIFAAVTIVQIYLNH